MRALAIRTGAALLVATGVLATAKTPTLAQSCTRLPLSDVAFGREAATNAARVKLEQYARDVGKTRGWPANARLRKSNETVSCSVYLNLGPLGTEYQCLVTATFCVAR
ncbi:MAG: hypothetical protein AAFY64_04015 [Pseudomonadota bacterium]